jgi:hypothetical protein
MRLIFGLGVDRCPVCAGPMKLRALVREPASIERFLRQQGLSSEPHDLAPDRERQMRNIALTTVRQGSLAKEEAMA